MALAPPTLTLAGSGPGGPGSGGPGDRDPDLAAAPTATPAPAAAPTATPAPAPLAPAPVSQAPAAKMTTSQTTIAIPGRTCRYRPTRTRPTPRPTIRAASTPTTPTTTTDDGPFAPDPPAAWPPVPGTAAQIPPFLGQPPASGHPPPASHSPPARRPPPGGHCHHPAGQPGRPPPNPPPRGQPGRPPPGLLDLVISWRALTGDPAGPATLSRIGPITGGQALLLALTAAADPHARWQVILTDPDGYAIATETIRRRHRQAPPTGRPG